MKPAPFTYHRASSVEDAVAVLARYDGEARILAGGQSLMPMLAFRLVQPAALIDIGRISELRRMEAAQDGLTLGACVRWCDIERNTVIGRDYPLLRAAVRHVAHYQIRNRGTVGGSLAHADPAAEWPAAVLASDGVITLAGPGGSRREVPAGEFSCGLLTTALAQDEMIVSIFIPKPLPGHLWGFAEFARRTGDFALAGVALRTELHAGRLSGSRVVAFGAGETPLALENVERALDDAAPDARTIEIAGEAALGIEPEPDIRVPPAYRKGLLRTLLRRALTEAFMRASAA